jgi:hypothetical protein
VHAQGFWELCLRVIETSEKVFIYSYLRHGLVRHPPWGGRIRLRKSAKKNLFRKRFLIHASNSLYPVSYKKPFSEVSDFYFSLLARGKKEAFFKPLPLSVLPKRVSLNATKQFPKVTVFFSLARTGTSYWRDPLRR